MSNISTDVVKKLRDQTGCSVMDVKEAIEYSKGDLDIALAYLRAKGLSVATPGMSFDERVQLFLDK